MIEELKELRCKVASPGAGGKTRGEIGTRDGDSDSIFRQITDNIDEVIFMFSPDWRETIYVSPAYEKIWGRPVEEVYCDALSWMEAIEPGDRGRVEAIIEGQARGEVALENSTEFCLRDNEGHIRWISARTYPVRDESGTVSRITGIAEDITERKNAEGRLRDSEKFLNNIFDCFQDGISILDKDLNIVRVNHVMEKWYPEMIPLMGKKCFHVYHGRSEPCERCPSIRAIRKKTAQSDVVPFDVEGGKQIGWLELYAFPLKDDDGNVIGVIEHVRDVTGRKQTESALRDSEEKYRSLVENINDMVWEFDGDFRVTYASPRTRDIMGYEAEEVIGKQPFDFILREDLDEFGSVIDEAVRARAPVELAGYRVRRKDGRVVYFETNGMPIFNGDGSFRGYRGINRDITERKRAELEKETAVEFLRLVNESEGTSGLVRSAAIFFQQKSGCEAVGIRLREGDDYPYYEACGFRPEFIRKENRLCNRDARGQIIRDKDGFPVLDCMCGNVITGRSDPGQPFFTSRGSFWTNSTTELLASTTEKDRLAKTRNVCYTEGYESFALIALRVGDERLGVLQLSDRRKGHFTLEQIKMWERLADQLAVALAKTQAEESLNLLQYMIDHAQDEASLAGPDGRFCYVNDAKCRSLGYTRDELLSMHIWDVDPAVTPEKWPELWKDLKEKGFKKIEAEHRTKDGRDFPAELWTNYLNFRGKEYVCALVRDITERKHAETEVLKSNKKYRSLVENVNDWVWEVDENCKYTYSSPRVRDLLGYEPEEMIGKSPFDFMTPKEARKVEEAFRPIFEGRQSFALLENQLMRKDGRCIVVETNGTPLFDDSGRFTGYMGVDRDTSERRKAEKSLKLTQFTMDRAGDMVLWVAPDSRFIYVNEAACRTFGYTREEMIAMTAFDTCPSWTDESWAEHWREIKERGSFTVEKSLRKKDGSFFPGEISVNYLVYDGKEYNCSFVRDITDRKCAEDALKESEEKFRVLAETTRAGILLYLGKKVVYVNPALENITGYGKDELLGMNYWDVVDTDQKEMVRSRGLARQQGRQKLPSTYELKIKTKAGETRWAEISAALISYHGRQTGLATIYDITDRKRSEAELHDAKGQAELYLDLMGHDINNLNQIGIGFLEMALATLKLDRESRELIARPLEALEASSRLIGNVRKLQKIKEGGLKFKEIRIADMLREIAPRYSDIPGRNVRIGCHAGCDCTVRANDLLDDVFSNIIHNAIKHSTGPLAIDIHLSTARVGERKYCLVAIEDDGPGIAEDVKGRLFSRSGQGNAKASGRGLGLHLVRTLVEDFDGKVWVEDRVRGDHMKGTRFVIMLPAVENMGTRDTTDAMAHQ